jgi:hypothetical protein
MSTTPSVIMSSLFPSRRPRQQSSSSPSARHATQSWRRWRAVGVSMAVHDRALTIPMKRQGVPAPIGRSDGSSCEYRPRQVVRSRPRQTTTDRGCRDLRRYPCLFGIVDDLVVDRRSTTSQRSEHHGDRRRFVVDRGSHHAFRHLGPRQRLERPHHRCGLDDRRCPSAPFCQSASGRAGGGFGRHGGDRTIAQERESARYNSRDRYPQPVGTVAKPFVWSDLRRRWYFST